MKTIIYAIYDRAVAVYGRPIFAPAWGALARDLKEVIQNGTQDMISKHPDDFDVYEMGAFEDSSGDFQIYSKPLLVCNCGGFVSVPEGNRSSALDTSEASTKPPLN